MHGWVARTGWKVKDGPAPPEVPSGTGLCGPFRIPEHRSRGLEEPAVSGARWALGRAQGPPPHPLSPQGAHLSRCAYSGGERSPRGRSSRNRPGGCGSGGHRAVPLPGAPGTHRCLGEGCARQVVSRERDGAAAPAGTQETSWLTADLSGASLCPSQAWGHCNLPRTNDKLSVLLQVTQLVKAAASS